MHPYLRVTHVPVRENGLYKPLTRRTRLASSSPSVCKSSKILMNRDHVLPSLPSKIWYYMGMFCLSLSSHTRMLTWHVVTLVLRPKRYSTIAMSVCPSPKAKSPSYVSRDLSGSKLQHKNSMSVCFWTKTRYSLLYICAVSFAKVYKRAFIAAQGNVLLHIFALRSPKWRITCTMFCVSRVFECKSAKAYYIRRSLVRNVTMGGVCLLCPGKDNPQTWARFFALKINNCSLDVSYLNTERFLVHACLSASPPNQKTNAITLCLPVCCRFLAAGDMSRAAAAKEFKTTEEVCDVSGCVPCKSP